MCEEAAQAPEQKSARSTSSTSTPCRARSRNVPMPLMPSADDEHLGGFGFEGGEDVL